LRIAFWPVVGRANPYTTFYFAVALSTWLFESGPGLLCLAVCAGAGMVFLLDPNLPPLVADPAEQVNFALFALSAFGVWLIVAKLKSTQMQLKLTLSRLAASEHEARAANQAKDDFLTMISHELRNPLNSLTLSARLLATGGPNQEQGAHSVAVINRAAQKLARMVDDLVDSARITSGRLTIQRESLDLAAVARAAIDLMAPSAEAKGITLNARIELERAIVRGDRERLQDCILNLIGNAIKFTPRDGTIEVAIHNGGRVAELCVHDSGDGIDADFLPHVFERFAQGGAGSSNRRGGLGLGLFIVRHVIEMHGGSIAVSSAGRGLGATFTMTLPLLDESQRI
ncbi:MAG TPA: HAMP domain-containing sensor histidine kinase, partial [Candidatus Binataceae bacterium]|nr:HAMP domain-containing sensor histidine kinase [Candidatus Binataceae bacterium]